MARFLLTADWHIRGDAPACRVNPDNWKYEQKRSIAQLIPIAQQCDEMWILGDLFHRARTSTEATVATLSMLSRFDGMPIRVLPGNHDLLEHSINNLECSTIGNVFYMENIVQLESHDTADGLHVEAYPFGMEPDVIPDCDIWCTHQLVFPDDKARPMPDCGVIAQDLVNMCPNAKFILTGDYHHGYDVTIGNTTVVACGCLNIQVSDMADYTPRCYILDTKTMSVEVVLLQTYGEVSSISTSREDTELNTYKEGLPRIAIPRLDYVTNAENAAALENNNAVKEEVHSILREYVPNATKE